MIRAVRPSAVATIAAALIATSAGAEPPSPAATSERPSPRLAVLSAAPREILPPRSQASPRTRVTINEHWRYVSGDPEGAAALSFGDSEWSVVNLPHTWNADDGFAEAVGYRRGVGWYRKSLALDPALQAARLFLYFEGANQVADVFVNGRSAGRHVGGYTAFVFDITDLVTFDAVNVIAVRVDNRHDDDIPPLNADFTFYGGIYRDVWLIATSNVHIDMLDHASPGIFIDTPDVSAEYGTVRIRGTVVNQEPRGRRVDVVNRVIAPDGTEITTTRSRLNVPAGGAASFEQLTARIARPLLWSPDEPNLYRVVTEVRDGSTLLDRTQNPLGFRWFNVDASRGFSLNGQPVPLYGTNRHQDRPVYGNALPNHAHREDVELVKATGFNFLRLAHYPQDPVVLEEMDRQGLIGWEEIPVVNIISRSAAFADNAERMLVEMIRQHYNHPSILFWGYMNEVLLRKPDPMPDDYLATVLALAQRLKARVHAEDATRATVIAVSFDEVDDGSGVQDEADVLGLNLYFGWYYRTLDGFGPYLDSLHARHPTRPLLISEYGAGSDERVHTLAPRAFDFSTEHQRLFHESSFRQIRERSYLIGSAVWNHFDFGSKGRHDSKPNINQKGLLYFDRTPKDIWYYYRAVLRAEPVLHIATRDWPARAGSAEDDARQPIVVYTNLDEVELFLNGTSLGSKRPENAVAEWTVTLRHGYNRVEAVGPAAERDSFTLVYTDRTSFFHDAAARVDIFAVNAGAHYHFLDESGTVWEADRPYTGGSWGHTGGESRLRHHRIYGSGDDPLYQVQQDGVQHYRFDVPDGSYEVTLLFTEMEHQAAGSRVFGVRINGNVVFTALDLAGMHGRYRAVGRTAVVDADNGTGIVIDFSPIAGSTTISGIRLRRR